VTQLNLPHSILTQLQAPLTPEEKLWALNLPLGFRRALTAIEGKMLVRLPQEQWPDELQRKAEKYIEFDDV